MAVRTLCVVALLLGAAAAGCIGGNDDGNPDVRAANLSVNNTFAKPPDGRDGNISAFDETTKTEEGVGGMAHNHDMWEGKTRINLFDVQSMMDPSTGGDSEAIAIFSVPRGSLVYEGTTSVEFTITNPERHVCEGAFTYGAHFICTDDTSTVAPGVPPVSAPDPTNGPAGIKLRYRHASASSWIDVGEIQWNTPRAIKVTDGKQTDMPHATSSLWQFMIVSPNGYDNTLKFRAKADIVRDPNAPIPLWPGHPDFYADGHYRQIFSGEVASVSGTLSGISSDEDAKPVVPKKLISYGTKSLYVWANVTSMEATNPLAAPTALYLYHTNATGQENITSPGDANASSDGKNFFWILPVLPDDMDSPYQDSSRWEFQLRGALANCVNCAEYSMKYNLVIHASDVDEKDKYHIYCYDATIC